MNLHAWLLDWGEVITDTKEAIPERPVKVGDIDRMVASNEAPKAIEAAQRMIQSAQDGNKHFALLKASGLLGGFVAVGVLEQQKAFDLLKTEISNKPNVNSMKLAQQTIKKGLEWGSKRPFTAEKILTDKIEYAKNQNGNGAILSPMVTIANSTNTTPALQRNWQWLGLDDLKKDPVTPIYIVDGVIPEKTLNLFFGRDGHMKSLACQYIAVCVAGGVYILNSLKGLNDGIKTAKTTVLWYDSDNGETIVHQRLRAFMVGLGVWPENLHYLSYPEPLFDAGNDVSVSWMIEDIEHFKAGLVFIDNLSTTSGSLGENNDEIQIAMNGFKRIVNHTGAAIILIHHATKSSGEDRGHGRIRQNCDQAFKVQKPDIHSQIVIIEQTKARFNVVPKLVGRFDYQSENNVLTNAAYYGATEPEPEATKAQDVKVRILTLLADNPELNQTDIVTAIQAKTKAARNTILPVIKELEDTGQIETHSGPHNSKLYSLVE